MEETSVLRAPLPFFDTNKKVYIQDKMNEDAELLADMLVASFARSSSVVPRQVSSLFPRLPPFLPRLLPFFPGARLLSFPRRIITDFRYPLPSASVAGPRRL